MNLKAQFETVYSRSPTIAVQSPGRINLIGEHIDYLGGCVLPAAIDRYLTILAAPRGGNEVRVWSKFGGDRPVSIALEDLARRTDPAESWLNYVIGVMAGYRDKGVDIPGFDAAIFSDIPSGAGLSSSAALETATALAIEALTGERENVIDRALLCQEAEHDFAGVPCGIMDQLAVGAGEAGHATLVDCRHLSLRPVKIPRGVAIVVADTRVSHALGDGEYRKRREDCEQALEILGLSSWRDAALDQVEAKRDTLGDHLFRRARHAVTEICRVEAFASSLEQSDTEQVAKLMRAGHESLRDDFEVSCEELDFLVDAAYRFGLDRGLLGSRMTGGGFGGSTVSLVREESAEALKAHLETAFEERFGTKIEPFVTEAAAGARILESGFLSRS